MRSRRETNICPIFLIITNKIYTLQHSHLYSKLFDMQEKDMLSPPKDRLHFPDGDRARNGSQQDGEPIAEDDHQDNRIQPIHEYIPILTLLVKRSFTFKTSNLFCPARGWSSAKTPNMK